MATSLTVTDQERPLSLSLVSGPGSSFAARFTKPAGCSLAVDLYPFYQHLHLPGAGGHIANARLPVFFEAYIESDQEPVLFGHFLERAHSVNLSVLA